MTDKTDMEAARRRVFAIISHPDAGKTTLTENMLLVAGAIHQAGAVAARGRSRRTQSDWMKIEQERGISVSSSVMAFDYEDLRFNLLDTPGHEDFSEDTYRTLTAADCAVMVLDAAKGIEAQTLKLFEVCRLRDIPIVTFINKLDRPAEDIFALLAQIEDKLALDVVPMGWPAGSGNGFRGVMDRSSELFLPYSRDRVLPPMVADESALAAHFDDMALLREFQDELMLADEYGMFDPQSFLDGHMTPVCFGSALRQFGIRELLSLLVQYAPSPKAETAIIGGCEQQVSPSDRAVSGFVFKVQANMDLNHRDRVAFVRLVSGEFKRGMRLKTATGRAVSVHNPILFFAQDRTLADVAYAGDIMGIPNHGTLRVGDSLSESGRVRFSGIPNFAPEILRRACVTDPLKTKHVRKALLSLAEEGVTQLFMPLQGADLIVGAVGRLQIDVMVARMSAEYGLEVRFEPTAYEQARWLSGEMVVVQAFVEKNHLHVAEDIDGEWVFLAKSAWEIGYAQEKNPEISFLNTKERYVHEREV